MIFLRRKPRVTVRAKSRAGTGAELIEPPFPLPMPLEFRHSARARRLSLQGR